MDTRRTPGRANTVEATVPLPIDPELRPWVPLLPVLDIEDPAAARATLAAMRAAAPEFVLDDRVDTPSAQEFTATPMWNRPNALHSWRHYLSASDPAAPVSPYAAPARADDLTGLPPAHVMVCDLDPLRDEGLDYAQRLVRSGVPTELQLFPGTFHGAEGAVPDTAVTRRMRAGLIDAVRRGLAAR